MKNKDTSNDTARILNFKTALEFFYAIVMFVGLVIAMGEGGGGVEKGVEEIDYGEKMILPFLTKMMLEVCNFMSYLS